MLAVLAKLKCIYSSKLAMFGEEKNNGKLWFGLENVSVFESQSIWIIYCNLAIRLIESKYLKMTKAIRIIEFKNCQKLI